MNRARLRTDDRRFERAVFTHPWRHVSAAPEDQAQPTVENDLRPGRGGISQKATRLA